MPFVGFLVMFWGFVVGKTERSRAVRLIVDYCTTQMHVILTPIQALNLMNSSRNVADGLAATGFDTVDQQTGTVIADVLVERVMMGRLFPINQTRWTWPDVDSNLGYRLEFFLEFERAARDVGFILGRGWY